MKQVIKFKSPKEHYKADACVVWCFDDRFTGLLGELNKFGLENVDLVRVAGGAKDLVTRGSRANFVLDQIDKSIRLHHTPLVILMIHESCGAYGKLSVANEKDFLSSELQKAKKIVASFLSRKGHKIKVKICLADFDGLWDVDPA